MNLACQPAPDLTLPMRNLIEMFYARAKRGRFHTAKTQCGQWLGMAFVRILVRDHTDGGTGETRMGMEDECRDPVRAAQHRACTVARRRPSMLERTCDARFSQAGRDALRFGGRGAFLEDLGGRTYGGGSCTSYLSIMRSYFTPC